jgi:hypothetical protein
MWEKDNLRVLLLTILGVEDAPRLPGTLVVQGQVGDGDLMAIP